jgi:hypothetical protein
MLKKRQQFGPLASSSGMTLVELMLALSLATLIGLAITSMTVAVADAQKTTSDLNDSTQAARCSMVGVERLVGGARLVSEGDANSLSLWMGDLNGDGQVNADETIYLTYYPAQRVLRSRYIKFPGNINPAYKTLINVELALSQSAVADVLDALIGCGPYIHENDVAVDVDSLEFKLMPAPPLTESVVISGRFSVSGQTVSLNTTVRLRADATSNVVDDGGEYVLNIPACEVTSG